MTEQVLIKGNEAIGEAAIRAGCRYYFGYPITPQSELPEYMAKKLPTVNGVFLQAESEIAAINMVYGAAAAGVSQRVGMGRVGRVEIRTNKQAGGGSGMVVDGYALAKA